MTVSLPPQPSRSLGSTLSSRPSLSPPRRSITTSTESLDHTHHTLPRHFELRPSLPVPMSRSQSAEMKHKRFHSNPALSQIRSSDPQIARPVLGSQWLERTSSLNTLIERPESGFTSPTGSTHQLLSPYARFHSIDHSEFPFPEKASLSPASSGSNIQEMVTTATELDLPPLPLATSTLTRSPMTMMRGWESVDSTGLHRQSRVEEDEFGDIGELGEGVRSAHNISPSHNRRQTSPTVLSSTDSTQKKPHDRASAQKPHERDSAPKPHKKASTQKKPHKKASAQKQPHERASAQKKPREKGSTQKKPINKEGSAQKKPYTAKASAQKPHSEDSVQKKPHSAKDSAQKKPHSDKDSAHNSGRHAHLPGLASLRNAIQNRRHSHRDEKQSHTPNHTHSKLEKAKKTCFSDKSAHKPGVGAITELGGAALAILSTIELGGERGNERERERVRETVADPPHTVIRTSESDTESMSSSPRTQEVECISDITLLPHDQHVRPHKPATECHNSNSKSDCTVEAAKTNTNTNEPSNEALSTPERGGGGGGGRGMAGPPLIMISQFSLSSADSVDDGTGYWMGERRRTLELPPPLPEEPTADSDSESESDGERVPSPVVTGGVAGTGPGEERHDGSEGVSVVSEGGGEERTSGQMGEDAESSEETEREQTVSPESQSLPHQSPSLSPTPSADHSWRTRERNTPSPPFPSTIDFISLPSSPPPPAASEPHTPPHLLSATDDRSASPADGLLSQTPPLMSHNISASPTNDFSSSTLPLSSGNRSTSPTNDHSSSTAPLSSGNRSASPTNDLSSSTVPLLSGNRSASPTNDFSSSTVPLSSGNRSTSPTNDFSSSTVPLSSGNRSTSPTNIIPSLTPPLMSGESMTSSPNSIIVAQHPTNPETPKSSLWQQHHHPSNPGDSAASPQSEPARRRVRELSELFEKQTKSGVSRAHTHSHRNTTANKEGSHHGNNGWSFGSSSRGSLRKSMSTSGLNQSGVEGSGGGEGEITMAPGRVTETQRDRANSLDDILTPPLSSLAMATAIRNSIGQVQTRVNNYLLPREPNNKTQGVKQGPLQMGKDPVSIPFRNRTGARHQSAEGSPELLNNGGPRWSHELNNHRSSVTREQPLATRANDKTQPLVTRPCQNGPPQPSNHRLYSATDHSGPRHKEWLPDTGRAQQTIRDHYESKKTAQDHSRPNITRDSSKQEETARDHSQQKETTLDHSGPQPDHSPPVVRALAAKFGGTTTSHQKKAQTKPSPESHTHCSPTHSSPTHRKQLQSMADTIPSEGGIGTRKSQENGGFQFMGVRISSGRPGEEKEVKVQKRRSIERGRSVVKGRRPNMGKPENTNGNNNSGKPYSGKSHDASGDWSGDHPALGTTTMDKYGVLRTMC